jgi:hypothetical protein
VAVANGSDKVMTSPDGIDWTLRTAISANWISITYGNGLFVAVATYGTHGTNEVMTSRFSSGSLFTSGNVFASGDVLVSGDIVIGGNLLNRSGGNPLMMICITVKGPSRNNTSTAKCPTGTIRTGGGCETGCSAIGVDHSSWPSGANEWSCKGCALSEAVASAICCRIGN